MDQKYTRYQTPRAARADAEKFNRLYLIKNVAYLRPTYQIRFLAFYAQSNEKRLVLRVPGACEFSKELQTLIASLKGVVAREDY